jgi:hypothetical protein
MNEKIELIEGMFIGGAVPDIPDKRDFKWGIDVGRDSTPFDWNKGFDIEEVLGFSLKGKDQNGSGSCGGQAFSYYGAVKEFLMTKTYEERSAKFLYAQCFVPGGGSRGRDLCNIAIKQGFAKEALCLSYDKGNPPSEEFMEKVEDITDIARVDAKGTVALSYANTEADIDSIAQAIRDNGGVVLGVTGQNGKGWLTPFPQAPDYRDWGHWIYAGKAKIINGKKYIGVKNSWGDSIGEFGWQWIGEDYFNAKMSGTDSGKAVWYGWTLVLKLVDQKQEKTNLLKVIISLLLKLFKKNEFRFS